MINSIKKATFVALAVAVLAGSSVTAAQAGGYGGYGYNHGHGHVKVYNYGHKKHCFWKKKKFYSNHYGWVWKKVKVCHY